MAHLPLFRMWAASKVPLMYKLYKSSIAFIFLVACGGDDPVEPVDRPGDPDAGTDASTDTDAGEEEKPVVEPCSLPPNLMWHALYSAISNDCCELGTPGCEHLQGFDPYLTNPTISQLCGSNATEFSFTKTTDPVTCLVTRDEHCVYDDGVEHVAKYTYTINSHTLELTGMRTDRWMEITSCDAVFEFVAMPKY